MQTFCVRFNLGTIIGNIHLFIRFSPTEYVQASSDLCTAGTQFSRYIQQLGIFVVKRELIYSPFFTKSGHADNPATFTPCVKSMTANFILQNSQFFTLAIAL